MKRRLLIVLLLILLLSLCSCNAADRSREFKKIDKNYTLEIPVFTLRSSENSLNVLLSYYRNYELNEDGQIVSYDTSSDQNSWEKGSREYDDKGRCIKWSDKKEITTYEYNDDDQIIAINVTYNGKPRTSRIYKYDENGLLIRDESTSLHDTYISEYEYDLDENDRVTKSTEKTTKEDSDYTSIRSKSFKYNNANQLAECREDFSSKGKKKSSSTITYGYDAYGHLQSRVEKEDYNSNGKPKDWDSVYRYNTEAHRTVEAASDESILPADSWLGFEEEISIPEPDSVFSSGCTLEESKDGVYRYVLDPGVSDYNTLGIGEDHLYDLSACSTCPEAVNKILTYKAILSQLMGFEIAEVRDGASVAAKEGAAPVTLTYGFEEDGKYYLTLSFNHGDDNSDDLETAIQGTWEYFNDTDKTEGSMSYGFGEVITFNSGNARYYSYLIPQSYGQDKVVEGTYQIEDGQVITELNGYKSPFQHQIVNNELVLIWKVSDNEIREYHKIADN